MLQNLMCSFTGVAELGPLLACKMLQTLNCCSTRVAELGPLSAYTLLRTLRKGVGEPALLSADRSLTALH